MIIIIFYQAAERGLSIFEQCLSQNSLLYLARSCMTRIIMTSGDWAINVLVRKRTRHETSDFYHKTCQQEIYCKSDVLQKSQKPKTPMTFRFVNVWLKCNQFLGVGKPPKRYGCLGRMTFSPIHPIPLHSDIHPLLLHPAVFSDVLHQRLHELERASIVYCKQGRDQARECERKQEMHCYCVLCIEYWVLCIAYCKLGIAFCVFCIAYCDIVSWSECQRKWECIGLASAWYSY